MRKLFIKLIPQLALIGVIIIFFLPQLLIGKIPIPADNLIGLYHPWRDVRFQGYNEGKFPPKNPLITDPILQTYPWRKLVIDNFKNFEMPLWNPYSFSGQPLMANIQSAAFNPINVIFFPIPFNLAWAFQILLSVIFSSIFMYIFLRSLKLEKISAFFGAVVLPFTGFFIVWLTWGTVSIVASLLPLSLFCINKIARKLTSHHLILLTSALTITLLSGHSQTAIYIIFAGLFYTLFLAITYKKWGILLVYISSLVLALVIASPQLILTIEFLRNSNRLIDQAYFPQKDDWFLPIQNLTQLFAPDYFGNPTRGNYWGIWNYGEFVSFTGILPLFFAIMAIVKTNKKTIFFTALAIISLLIALKNPISQLPYTLNFPLISSMQPSRIIFLLTFSLVVLSAFGFESFIKGNNRKQSIIALLIIVFPIGLLILLTSYPTNLISSLHDISIQRVALRNLIIPALTTIILITVVLIGFRKSKNILVQILIILLALFELFYFAYKFTPFSSLEIIFPGTKITEYLSKQEKPFRVMSTDRRIASPNSLLPYKIEMVSGYDPLYLKKYGRLAEVWQSNQTTSNNSSFNRIITPQNYLSNFTNIMNVKYILTFDDINEPGFEKVLQEGETKLYKNKNVTSRAFFVTDIVMTQSEDETLENLLKLQTSGKIAYSQNFKFQGGDTNAQAKILNYTEKSMTVATKSGKETPLIISNIYYPGWKVYIDGIEEKVLEVDYLLQCAIIPEGEHMVTFIYKPQIFYNSFLISISGIIILFTTSVIVWKKYQ